MPSSLIDHCWNYCPAISSKNVNLAVSDHNLLEIKIRISGSDYRPKEYIYRDKSKLDITKYQQLVDKIDWTSLYEATDINIANSIFEEKN